MMGDVIRFLISNDSAIDNMTEEDILELATFGDDYIPNDIENLFADFCPGFEEEREIFLSENPDVCLKIEKRASLMKEKYLSNLSDEEDLDEYVILKLIIMMKMRIFSKKNLYEISFLFYNF